MEATRQVSVRKKKAGIGGYLRSLEVVDYRLLISIIFLLAFGLMMIYSATSATDGLGMVKKQAIMAAAGLFIMFLVSYIDYHFFVNHARFFYIAALISLLLVRIPGLSYSANGATRWIRIGSYTLQPSELMKPAIIILMTYAVLWAGRNIVLPRFAAFIMFPSLLAAALILVLTRNLSTAVIVMGISFLMFFVAHPDKRVWGIVLLLVALVAVFGVCYYNFVVIKEVEAARASGHVQLDSFRAGRIIAWLYPEEFTGISMQTRYSLYSIGFGGLLGRGLGHGTMKYYLPEAGNDFIFAVIAEELGIVGCLMVIFLFVYHIFRIMVLSQHAKDIEGSYLAFGIGAHIALQALLNIGVATSVLPNTGISLPYISHGGTALLIQLAEMGIVLNISKQIRGRRVEL